MPKFQKRPVQVHAQQFTTDMELGNVAPPAGVTFAGRDDTKARHYFVRTLEGPMTVRAGDWIITGVKGEKYPCRLDIFELTYSRVPCNSMSGVTCENGRKPEDYCDACR